MTPSSPPNQAVIGTGFSICRSNVEAHGGRLSVARKSERGATLQFTLPLHKKVAS
ncbi:MULTISPECIES: ATP-binding protein [Bradyrhizobium]|uniref:ATP-binding protein n=1 Tax=Bradyrhizobium TaxID=374 RepID=UPI0030B934DD